MPGHAWVPPQRPDIKPPALVRDRRNPQRWGVLRQMGNRAARVQFGKDYKTGCNWVQFAWLELVPQDEIDAAIARERAQRREGEDLV